METQVKLFPHQLQALRDTESKNHVAYYHDMKEGGEKRADHTETKTTLRTENEKPVCIGFGRI